MLIINPSSYVDANGSHVSNFFEKIFVVLCLKQSFFILKLDQIMLAAALCLTNGICCWEPGKDIQSCKISKSYFKIHNDFIYHILRNMRSPTIHVYICFFSQRYLYISYFVFCLKYMSQYIVFII